MLMTNILVLIFGLALVFFSATKFFIPMHVSFGARGVISILGLLLIIVAFTVPLVSTPTTPTQQIAPSPTVAMDSPIHLGTNTTYSASTGLTVVATAVYGASPSITYPVGGVVKFDFVMYRTDIINTPAIFTVSLTNNQLASNATSSASNAYIVNTPTTNNTPQIFFQTPQINSPVASGSANVVVPAAGQVQVNVTADLSAQALSNLHGSSNPRAGLSFDIEIGGNNGALITLPVVVYLQNP